MANKPNDPVILSACRTPIGTFLGSLSSLRAHELGALVIAEAVQRAGVGKEDIDEVIMGQVVQAGEGQAPARMAAIKAGVPGKAGVMTINKVCGSGLKAVMLAAQSILLKEQHVVVAGGQESMSNTPYVLHKAKSGLKFGHTQLMDSMILDGLWDSFNDFHMGLAAEYTAEKSKLTREMLDEYAANSQRKASDAIAAGKFKGEIVPVSIPQRRGDPIAAFKKDGVVTAGNAPGLNDGASAVVVTCRQYAEKHNIKPMARITGYTVAGTEPIDLFYAPIYAVRKLCGKLGVDLSYFDLIEANEAFAAQCLADGNELGWDWDKVNIHGGAIALGHPIGASGARVLTTLLYALKDRGKKHGLATLCLGGGNAVAMSIEME